jgi:hypothetical protein
MSLKQLFGTNKTAEIEGVWIDITDNEDGSKCRMKLSRMGTSNRKFTQQMARRSKKSRGTAVDNMNVAKLQKEMIEVFASTILVDWENVVDWRATEDESKPVFLEYSKDNAIWLLNELPDLFDVLTSEAMNITNFQVEANEAEAKNLQPSSSTN